MKVFEEVVKETLFCPNYRTWSKDLLAELKKIKQGTGEKRGWKLSAYMTLFQLKRRAKKRHKVRRPFNAFHRGTEANSSTSTEMVDRKLKVDGFFLKYCELLWHDYTQHSPGLIPKQKWY